MSQFIGTTMPRGYAGEITRGYFDHTVEIKENDVTTPVEAAGLAVALTEDGRATVATDASKIFGFSTRDYRQVGPDGKPWPVDRFVGVLRRGYMAVKCAGTPKIGAPVYLADDGTVTAEAADGSTAIANCVFAGTIDEDDLVEIAFNI